jgi:hypothetical protein
VVQNCWKSSNNFYDFCYGRMDTYYLYALLINGTPFGVDVEELPENIHLETAAAVTHDGKDSAIITSFSLVSSIGKKWKRKSPVEVLKIH